MADAPDQPRIRFASELMRRGFTALPNRVLCDPALSNIAKLLYAHLARYAWQTKECFPGMERLRADLGASDNTIRDAKSELVEGGFLTQKRQGQGKPNLYVLCEPTSKFEVLEPSQTEVLEPSETEVPYIGVKKTQLILNPEPQTASKTEVQKPKRKQVKNDGIYSEAFKAFWKFYPRKTAPGAAWKAFKKLDAKDQHDAVERSEAYGEAWELYDKNHVRRSYCPHPSTWLNDRRWEESDEAYIAAAKGTG